MKREIGLGHLVCDCKVLFAISCYGATTLVADCPIVDYTSVVFVVVWSCPRSASELLSFEGLPSVELHASRKGRKKGGISFKPRTQERVQARIHPYPRGPNFARPCLPARVRGPVQGPVIFHSTRTDDTVPGRRSHPNCLALP